MIPGAGSRAAQSSCVLSVVALPGAGNYAPRGCLNSLYSHAFYDHSVPQDFRLQTCLQFYKLFLLLLY